MRGRKPAQRRGWEPTAKSTAAAYRMPVPRLKQDALPLSFAVLQKTPVRCVTITLILPAWKL